MTFKEWLLKETGTSTSCIAGFPRVTLPMMSRRWPVEDEDEKDPKKKKKTQPQVKK